MGGATSLHGFFLITDTGLITVVPRVTGLAVSSDENDPDFKGVFFTEQLLLGIGEDVREDTPANTYQCCLIVISCLPGPCRSRMLQGKVKSILCALRPINTFLMLSDIKSLPITLLSISVFHLNYSTIVTNFKKNGG